MSTPPNPPPIYILITGISPGGLGDALTTELLKHPNTHILATGLSLTHLSHLPSSPRISKLELDVTSPTSISTALQTTTTITSGRLNYLINNAGYGYMMPLLDASPQAVQKNFDVNVFGLLAVTQAFFPLLREAKGTVVNQCSIASLAGGRQPFIGSYCASKAAVASLNDTMRVEFGAFGVNVSVLFLRVYAWDGIGLFVQ
jgi:1-acylglycerone phosphate reductase